MRCLGGLTAPVAWMGLSPLPHALDMVGAFEVITVGGFVSPLELAGLFAGFAALGLGTVALAPGAAGVGIKEHLTVSTFMLASWTSHWPVSPQVNDPHLTA